MQFKSTAFFVAGLADQQAVATGWTDASSYSCPGNTDNHCSPDQQHGYDWSGLSTGSFGSYGSNKFSGFTCSDSFGKRDGLTKRSFQSKCITGNLDDAPSMSGDAFSIDQMQISSSHDADIEAHYGMPDGSTCKEIHSCSTQGTVFHNTQCGGAKSVTFKPGKHAPSGCSIGVHSVGFHCGPPSKPPSTPSTSVSVQSVPPYTPSSPTCYGKHCTTSSAPVGPASSSPPSPPCYGKHCTTSSAPAPPCYGKDCTSSSTPVAPVSSSPPSPPCYGEHCSTSPVAPASSSVPPPCYGDQCTTYTPFAPVSSSVPPPCYGKDCSTPVAPASSSPPAPPCYGKDCSTPVSPASSSVPPPCYGPQCSPLASTSPAPPCYGASCSTPPVAPVSSTPPSYPTPHCPDVLPRCLKTWMFLTTCKDNSDHNCFCGNEKFIKNVMACLSAWSISDSDIQAAASYLMGICAAHVPNNPAIITACPPGVTPGPSPAAPTPVPSSPAGPTAPCTTITYSSSTLVTTVTVPKVSFENDLDFISTY